MASGRREGGIVASRYRLERPIGEGGFAEVWAAIHLVTRRRVALKFLKERHASDLRLRQRFVREGRAASAVRHPNVIVIHDVFEDDGVPLIVMDLLEGQSLCERLAREGPLALAEAARVVLQVVSAVEAAHALGIVHRDLKPDNIFLVRRSSAPDAVGDVRVLDFGIAKMIASELLFSQSAPLTHSGAMLGTPLYMSPEQFFGDDEVDERSDVWAIGVILYECLCGVRPTEAKSVGHIVKVILSESIPPLSQRYPALPENVSAIVMRALSFDRTRRPPLAEIAETLAKCTSDPTPAPPSPWLTERGRTVAVSGAPTLEATDPLSQSRSSTQAPMTLPEGERPRTTTRASLRNGGLAAGVAALALALFLRHGSAGTPTGSASSGSASAGASSARESTSTSPMNLESSPSSITVPSVAPSSPRDSESATGRDAGTLGSTADAAARPAAVVVRPIARPPASAILEPSARPFDPGSVR